MPTVFGVSVDDAKASRALSLYKVDGSVCIEFALCAYIIIWVELPKRCFLGSVFMYIYIRLALSSYVRGFFCDVMTPALAMIFLKLNIIFVQSTVDKSIYRTGASRVFFWGVVFDVLLSLHSCIFLRQISFVSYAELKYMMCEAWAKCVDCRIFLSVPDRLGKTC